jgi:DNA-binding HxlR family transcriptional regulator
MDHKSLCPINQALELFGDRWTLLIIRDIFFNGKSSYREFLQSDEKIASNVLADRLKLLEQEGVLVKKRDPRHKQKIIYTLTEKGIDLLPVLIQIGNWSARYYTLTGKDKSHVRMLERGGARLQNEIKKQFLVRLKK